MCVLRTHINRTLYILHIIISTKNALSGGQFQHRYVLNTLWSYAQLDDTHIYLFFFFFFWRHIYLIFFSCYLKVVPIFLALINIYGSTVCIIYDLAVKLKPTSLLWVWVAWTCLVSTGLELWEIIWGLKGPLCLPLAWFFGA